MILTLILTLIQVSAGLPAVSACDVLVLTSPRDGWRLTVMTDGSARLNYAALPQTVEAPAQAFDFSQLHAALTARSGVTSLIEDSGSVECRSSRGEVQGSRAFLDDEKFAVLQFERMWERASPASNSIEKEGVELLREMWNRRQRPR